MKLSPARPRISRLQTFAAALALCVASGQRAHAAVYTWDPGKTGTATGGGAGNWDLASTFWYNGTKDVAWPDNSTSSNTDTALFGGTPGTGAVTNTAAIGVNTIEFDASGYKITNGTGGTLTLIGTNPTIYVNNTGSD
ncbi:MAG: hypothetical protein INR62_08795, partial [Rhodospirillales bacterium]|nr:hypothetical protein [Acetobacter sp.]